MAETVLTELNFRPLKIPKLQEDCEISKQRELRYGDGDDDEYLRQYLLFHYQYEKTQGFRINWEQFDYVMYSRSLDQAARITKRLSNADLIKEATLFAIGKHNDALGTQLVLLEHLEANYRFANGFLYWLTFWAIDMSSSNPESKIYQAKLWRRGSKYEIPIFRLKPTDQEIDAVEVQPPSPILYDFDKPPIVFTRAGPEDDALPGVPFVFNRTGAGLDPDAFFPAEKCIPIPW